MMIKSKIGKAEYLWIKTNPGPKAIRRGSPS